MRLQPQLAPSRGLGRQLGPSNTRNTRHNGVRRRCSAQSAGGLAGAVSPALLAPHTRSPSLNDLLLALPPLSDDQVLYFAFGSNMEPATLTGRRQVTPRASAPAFVADHTLSFGMLGFPYSEPGFATIKRRSGVVGTADVDAAAASAAAARSVHGVLHVLSAADWERVKASEGVSGAALGYEAVQVTAYPYSPVRPPSAWPLATAQPSNNSQSGAPISAWTLRGAPASLHAARRGALPSARYLGLLRSGAAHHGLDPEYRARLGVLQAYEAPSNALAGRAAGGALLLAAAAPALPLVAAAAAYGAVVGRGSNTTSSSSSSSLAAYGAWYASAAQGVVWWAHDVALAPLFGSGAGPRERGGGDDGVP